MMQYDQNQRGFSLIELMIAMVIGLILLLAVLQVFVGSSVTYGVQSGLAKVQENGRFAMSFISRDLRQAGYTGCSRNTTLANTLNRNGSGAVPSYLDMGQTITGFDDMNGTDAFDEVPIAGTDVIEVRYVDPNTSCDVDQHVVNSANLHCTADHSFQRGDVLVVTDCKHTAIFQFSHPGTGNHIVVHNTGNAVSPGNCTKGLGTPVVCTANGTEYPFNDGVIMKMAAYRYYVAESPRGEPALYRETIGNSSGTANFQAQELLEGVENLQILYGEDANSDGSADYYVPFSEVAEEDDIVSVRVSLLIRSDQDNLVQGQQRIMFNGIETTFNDGYLRKVFTSTIALRNRL